MSVYIKGMEMPFGCGECPFVEGSVVSGELLLICKANGKLYGGKPGDCPLVPVPDHGRLIDADALLATERETFEDYHISEAPTIIPADEEGE